MLFKKSMIAKLTEEEKSQLAGLLVKSGYPFAMTDSENKKYTVDLGGQRLTVPDEVVNWFFNKLDIDEVKAEHVNNELKRKYEVIIRLAEAKQDMVCELYDYEGFLQALVQAGVMHPIRRRNTLDVLYEQLSRIIGEEISEE